MLRAKPSEVSSTETRAEICRAFKELATTGQFDDQRKGIEGMVKWAGKYSVPTLLEMLDRPHGFGKEHVYKALGDLKDERAAAPVARRLGQWMETELATSCLRKLGPLAEKAVIEVARSNDAKLSLLGVQLLGEIGTQRSASTLRTGQQSRNLAVRAASKAAMRAINERAKANGGEDKEE
jgi:HEAT repeat protein